MGTEKPVVATDGAHFLKGHASWLYCNGCNKTVAYLCYITYRYFAFDFICKCGCRGKAVNSFGDIDLESLSVGELKVNPENKRFCCAKDGSALFSVVLKNLTSYHAEVVCKECSTKYKAN